MRAWQAAAAWLFASLLAAAPAHASARLEIRGFAGRVAIIPESRADIAVGMIKRIAGLPVRVRRSGASTVIEGVVAHRVKGCPLFDGRQGVRVSGLGFVPLENLPSVVIRTPRDVRVSAGEGVHGVIGRSDSVDLDNRGCGDWTIANTRGRLRLTQLGAGRLSVGGAGEADLNVSGGGEIKVRSTIGTLTAVSTGEGSVSVAEADGPVVARVAGSGVIDIQQGGAPELNAQVAGSGAVRFGGSAGAVIASVAGPGEIVVAHASGLVTRRVFGPGHIQVGVGGDDRR